MGQRKEVGDGGSALEQYIPREHVRRGKSAASGAGLGAIAGSLLGGPIGAALGGAIGAAVGVAISDRLEGKDGQ